LFVTILTSLRRGGHTDGRDTGCSTALGRPTSPDADGGLLACERYKIRLAKWTRLKSLAVLAIILVCLVPLMKRSVAEKGAHIGAE
jgi:hypothetical protein